MTLPKPVIVFTHDPLPAEITDAQRSLGGKGESLRRMAAVGHRVPRGFTIVAEAGQRIETESDQLPDDVWHEIVNAVKRLETETGRSFASDSASKLLLAVRSGAAVSIPGLLRTHLSVGQKTDGLSPWDELRSAVTSVFASWHSDAAREYRRQHKIEECYGTAVTVQEQIDCDVSCVVFTQDPDQTQLDVIKLEAVVGCGDQLVSGQVTPSCWLINRTDGSVSRSSSTTNHDIDRNELTERLTFSIAEITRAALALEEVFECPIDIELGCDREGLIFFQARPIAQQAAVPSTSAYVETEIQQIRNSTSPQVRLWVRHNLGETLAHPKPLTWSLWQPFMSGSGGLGKLYRKLGFRPSRQACDESFLTLIGGQIYADPDRATGMFMNAYPFRYDPKSLADNPTQFDQAPNHFDPSLADPWLLWRLPVIAWRFWRSQRRIRRLMRSAAERFECDILPSFRQQVEQEWDIDLTADSEAELLSRFESRRRWILDEFAPESLLLGMLGGIALAELQRQLTRIIGPERTKQLLAEVMPVGNLLMGIRQRDLLDEVRRSSKTDSFMQEFGHHCIGEMELSTPRWRETPEMVRSLATQQGSDAQTLTGRKITNGDKAAEHLHQVFINAGARSLADEPLVWLSRCWEFLAYRDLGKHEFLRGYELLRLVAEEFARRTGLGDGVYFLTLDEWQRVSDGEDLSPVIEQRRSDHRAARELSLPNVINADQLPAAFAQQASSPNRRQWEGTPVVGGRRQGVIWNLSVSNNPPENRESVIVCSALEPSLAPLLTLTRAVVVEQGGTLSHGAILARQLRLPVVRLANATTQLTHDSRIVVDGDEGIVSLVDEEKT